jgi:hypothetical protein
MHNGIFTDKNAILVYLYECKLICIHINVSIIHTSIIHTFEYFTLMYSREIEIKIRGPRLQGCLGTTINYYLFFRSVIVSTTEAFSVLNTPSCIAKPPQRFFSDRSATKTWLNGHAYQNASIDPHNIHTFRYVFMYYVHMHACISSYVNI